MRTTLRLNDDLLAKAKRAAIESGRTLTAVVEDALAQSLAGPPSSSKRRRIRLPSSGRGGVRPGVNLNSAADLLEIMDDRDATA
ncbi:MAG: hypothetical protein ABFC77_12520 [Thermoguttaceae bacterium]